MLFYVVIYGEIKAFNCTDQTLLLALIVAYVSLVVSLIYIA